ncbi:hypothetical protein EYR40_002290 [Pleurotus pulmonarius]|nr:hypothetical protein EYR36_002219 [Pleurotus pulmonarius]KAF4583799.1 hypothetical protein EYR40_002290 [Pleurotus pulmonarius]
MKQPSSGAPETGGGSTNTGSYDDAVTCARESANALPEPSGLSKRQTPEQIWEGVCGLTTQKAQGAILETAANIPVERGVGEGEARQLHDVYAVSQLAAPSFEDPLQHQRWEDGTSGPTGDVFQQQHLIPAQDSQTAGSHQTAFELPAGFKGPGLPLEGPDVYGVDARVQDEYNTLAYGSEAHEPYHLSAHWELGPFTGGPVAEAQTHSGAFDSTGRSFASAHTPHPVYVTVSPETLVSSILRFFGGHVAGAVGPVRSERRRADRDGCASKGSRRDIATKPEDWPADRHWFRRGHLRQEQERLAEAVGAAFAMMAPVLLPQTVMCRWDMGRGWQCGRQVTRDGLFHHYRTFHEVDEVDGRVTCHQIDSEGGTCGATLTIADMEGHLVKDHRKLLAQCPLCAYKSTAPVGILKHLRSCKKYAGREGSIWREA